MNKLVLLLSFFVLAACSSPIKKPEGKLGHLNNIAIAPVFDDMLTTNINGRISALKDNNWSVSKAISSEFLTKLSGMNKKSFELNVNPERLEEGRREALGLKNIYLGNRYQSLELYLNEEAERQGASYLIIIHPSANPQFSAYKPGLEFFCSTTPPADLTVYMMISASIWDVKKKVAISRIPISPMELSTNLGKSCNEAKKTSTTNWLNEYKGAINTLAKKSSDLILSSAGIF